MPYRPSNLSSVILPYTLSSIAASNGSYESCALYLLSRLRGVPCLDGICVLDERFQKQGKLYLVNPSFHPMRTIYLTFVPDEEVSFEVVVELGLFSLLFGGATTTISTYVLIQIFVLLSPSSGGGFGNAGIPLAGILQIPPGDRPRTRRGTREHGRYLLPLLQGEVALVGRRHRHRQDRSRIALH